MRAFITGINGQLGHDIYKELENNGYDNIMCPTREFLDITDKKQVDNLILTFKPDVVFHCAAYTNVDGAEKDCFNCFNVNVNGTYNIMEACKKVNAKLVYISTDYVFEGDTDLIHDENDLPDPVNVYGITKYLADRKALSYENTLVARISWVFGINGKTLLKQCLD